MDLVAVVLIICTSWILQMSHAESDENVLRIFKELQDQVKSQNDLISSMQEELATQKTRIDFLEMHVEAFKIPQTNGYPPTSPMETQVDNQVKQENNRNNEENNQRVQRNNRFEQGNNQMERENNRMEQRNNRTEQENNQLEQALQTRFRRPNFTIGRIRPKRFLANDEDSVAVAFQSYLSADLTHIGLHQKIAFDSVTLNVGNAYHGTHGLFIAPRPGIYIFSGSVLAHHTKEVELSFIKNGVGLGGGILSYSAHNQGFNQGSATIVAQLKAGDEVWIENSWPDDTTIRATRNTCFMGCLIMEI